MSLHHETLNDALREVVQAAGGNKAVGEKLYPEKTVEERAGCVRDRLNPDRRELFSPDQVLFLLRLGREIGCHAAITYLNREAGYADPLPIEPEDEVARLQRAFIEASKNLQSMANKIEAIQANQIRRAA